MNDICEDANETFKNDLRFGSQLSAALYLGSHKYTRLYGSALARHGLTFSQYQVLIALWDSSPCSVSALCATLDLESSTITPLLKRLQVLGFVDRTRDRVDERRVLISLTEKGRAFKSEAAALRYALIDRLGMPREDIVELRRLLHKMMRYLDRIAPPVRPGRRDESAACASPMI